MSTEAETTTINSPPEQQQAPPKAQPTKKEKKKGRKCLPHFGNIVKVTLKFQADWNSE